MDSPSETSHIARARQRLRDRAQAQAALDEEMRCQAVRDVCAIVAMIVEKYAPIRIFQWGSVMRAGGFRAYSDVDLAVEGVTDAQAFFAMLGDAQALTRFPLDLVQIEKIAPEYAEDIRRHGKIIYERR